MPCLQISDVPGGVRFAVKVSPKASRQAIDVVYEGQLKIFLNAPPVDGAANQDLLKLLAKNLKIAPSRLSIVSGQHSRSKLVEAQGLTQQEVLDRLNLS